MVTGPTTASEGEGEGEGEGEETVGGPIDGLAAALHLYRTGQIDEAEARCRAIVERDPHCGEAWDRLARIAERQGRAAQAEAHYLRAVTDLRHPAEAHHNLAVLLQLRGALDDAQEHYRRALALGLQHALLHSNLGCLLRDRGHLQEAADEFARALALDDTSAHAHSNLGITLTLQGRVDRALPHLRRAVDLQPAWDLAHSNLLFCLNYADDVAPVEVAAHHLAFGRRHPVPEDLDGAMAMPVELDSERPLRVGFVSPDLKQHSVAYFLEPLLRATDRTAFDLVCYADVLKPDAVTERLRAAVERWRPIRGLADADVARLVRADRVDILIDLAGHTAYNRLSLFATRAAPVQMTYLGYCNTTGLDAVDWRITDAWADPPGLTESLHSEELLRVSHGFLCFQPHADAPAPRPPPACADGRVTFGSFNLPAKISPATLTLWAEILRRVPDSRLLLKSPLADPATRSSLAQRLAASPLAGHDVQVLGRVADERDHLAAYGGVDVALDTWPYGGTTTTCEALWMGVPVVTLTGGSHASRVGASLLTRLGAPELVAETPAAYIAAAVGLATDLDRLVALRSSLRARMASSGITDATAFARSFGEALRRAWRIRVEQERAHARPLPAATTLAPLVGDLRVVVPDTLDQITPYVLAEQHDWFEDEMTFVRALLARGERAIDIGANHGVYALTMARRVGFSGRVWAFEPNATVAARLRASIAVNALPQASVVEAALTSARAARAGGDDGRGLFVSGAQSELGRLVSDGDAEGGATTRVALMTLDDCRGRLGMSGIAFVKIDAEGAEADIIDGGREFFTAESPLVMFEVRQGAMPNMALLDRFHGLGYRGFRLIPGLGLLAPLDDGDPGAADLRALDPFTLNVFACKGDRAALLEQRGLLARASTAGAGGPSTAGASGAWRPYLHAQLFAAPLWPRWSAFLAAADGDRDPADRAYLSGLDQYALSRRITDAPAARHAALAAALKIIAACAGPRATVPVLQTLARVSYEAGARAVAIQALNRLAERCRAATDAEIDRPFLPVSPRFDDLPPGEEDGDRVRWVAAAVLEQRERLRAFSSFYTASDPATRACLESIAELGYQSPEMARRLDLVRRRAR